ncbi:MAG: hypothetical protein RR426_08880 [Oscillospiraceae bacterium]
MCAPPPCPAIAYAVSTGSYDRDCAAPSAQSPPSRALAVVSGGDSLDWKELPADEITRRVTSKVSPGSIVLFHNAALHTPEALPGILETLIGDGYTVVPISQLICTGDYTIDHTGRQCAVKAEN